MGWPSISAILLMCTPLQTSSSYLQFPLHYVRQRISLMFFNNTALKCSCREAQVLLPWSTSWLTVFQNVGIFVSLYVFFFSTIIFFFSTIKFIIFLFSSSVYCLLCLNSLSLFHWSSFCLYSWSLVKRFCSMSNLYLWRFGKIRLINLSFIDWQLLVSSSFWISIYIS